MRCTRTMAHTRKFLVVRNHFVNVRPVNANDSSYKLNMQLNTGITHCIDCGRSLVKEKQKLRKVKFNIPRCRDCYRLKVANYCQYFNKDGKQCNFKATCDEAYCSYHLELPPHLRAKYAKNRPMHSTDNSSSRKNRSRQKPQNPIPDIPDPCMDDTLPQGSIETACLKLLGVASYGASIDQIRNAYLRKALELHPDKNVGIDTTAQFQDVQEAYCILKAMYKSKE